MKRKTFSYAKYGYIFSIPFVVAFTLFTLFPILFTFFLAFSDLKGILSVPWEEFLSNPIVNFFTFVKNHFVGFQQFITVLKAPSFQIGFFNTVVIWLANFIPQMFLALLIAAWFTDKRCKIKGQGFFKVIFYLPNIITAATIALLFANFFNYPEGPMNSLLRILGILGEKESIEFLRDGWFARGVIIFIQTWMWYGYTSIVLMSGILGISPELFEAAEVDGAGRMQTFFKITLPNIKTIMLFTLVTSIIGGLNMFDIPKLFLDGKPDNATLTTAVYIYNQAFMNTPNMYARAAAASIIMFVIICVISAFMFYLLRDKDEVALRKIVRKQEKEYKKKLKSMK